MAIQTTAPILSLKGEPMKTRNKVDENGQPIPDPDSEDFTVRDAVAEAMFRELEGDEKTGPEEFKKYRIANLFFAGPVLETLNEEDRDIILERSGRCLGRLVHGRLYDALHNATQLAPPEPKGKGNSKADHKVGELGAVE